MYKTKLGKTNYRKQKSGPADQIRTPHLFILIMLGTNNLWTATVLHYVLCILSNSAFVLFLQRQKFYHRKYITILSRTKEGKDDREEEKDAERTHLRRQESGWFASPPVKEVTTLAVGHTNMQQHTDIPVTLEQIFITLSLWFSSSPSFSFLVGGTRFFLLERNASVIASENVFLSRQCGKEWNPINPLGFHDAESTAVRLRMKRIAYLQLFSSHFPSATDSRQSVTHYFASIICEENL